MKRPKYRDRVRVTDPENWLHGYEGTVRLLGPSSYDLDVKVRLDMADGRSEDIWFASESLTVILSDSE